MSIFQEIRTGLLRRRPRQPALPEFDPDRSIEIGGGTDQTPAGWVGQALRAVPVPWARVDRFLRIVEASPAAIEMMQASAAQGSLIAFSRTPEIEDRAREVLTGATGPWHVVAPHFDRRLRMTGQRLGDGGAVLFWEDETELRRLESVRTEFVANLAHELRTPVTSLRLAIETLTQGLPPEDSAAFLGRMIEEADYLSSVLDTLKELAELERGSIPINRERFSVAQLVEETWHRVARDGSRVSLTLTIAPQATIVADRPKIGEVLQNLLENAHRYSPAEGTIEVGASSDDHQLTVWVTDEGPGISPVDQPRIFERFYKADRSRQRSGGSGLGLAIAKHLVEAHGGRIWADQSPAGGAKVEFSLPREG